jgi:membrane-associated phospholipid phosphatase
MAQRPPPTDDSVAAPGAAAQAGEALRQEARFGVAFLRRHSWRLVLVFIGLWLPLWGFSELADEIHDREIIPFDEPVLQFMRGLASDGFDRAFVWISHAGYSHGVVPFDIAFVLALALLRFRREATFAAVALGGSGLLNLAAKHVFARERPALWDSIAPEATYSFPSGHAMGSATLACVLVLLAWRTRWRWPVFVVAAVFTLAVGLSRVYLGVHYPSDILAGWAAAAAWTAAVFLIVFRWRRRPWQGRPPA